MHRTKREEGRGVDSRYSRDRQLIIPFAQGVLGGVLSVHLGIQCDSLHISDISQSEEVSQALDGVGIVVIAVSLNGGTFVDSGPSTGVDCVYGIDDSVEMSSTVCVVVGTVVKPKSKPKSVVEGIVVRFAKGSFIKELLVVIVSVV